MDSTFLAFSDRFCANNPLKYIDPTGLSWDYADEVIADLLSTVEEPQVEELHPGDKGHPGEDFPYEEGSIFLDTPVEKCGDVGIAIGTYYIPGKSVDNGLVIITYQEDGEMDIEFYSFERLLREGYKKFVRWLEDKSIDLEHFDMAREELEKYCNKMAEKYGSEGLGASIGGLALGVISYWYLFLSPVGWVVAGYGIQRGAKDTIWTYRENYLGDLGDAIKKRIIEILKGGG